MFNEIIFDIETQKVFKDLDNHDPAGLGVSICSVYHRQLDNQLQEVSGQMTSFWEQDFPKMWPFFQNAHRIIGFNSLKFDLPALQAYTYLNLQKLSHFDLLVEFKKVTGHRASLNNLAHATLGETKIDSGLMAIRYWEEHSPESLAKLQHYCEHDVSLTKALYDFSLKNHQLKYKDHWNDLKTISVNFSYPTPISTPQISLF
jgi:hypothetical protein